MTSIMIDRLGHSTTDIELYFTEMVKFRMATGSVKSNSWGAEIFIGEKPGSLLEGTVLRFGCTKQGAEHDEDWYIENASGKNKVCLATGMDSHEAVRMWPGKLAEIEGVFPWGGAIIDNDYGLIIGFSGGKEDEDILVVRDVRNWLVMHADRVGEWLLKQARQRGELDGPVSALRFTRV